VAEAYRPPWRRHNDQFPLIHELFGQRAQRSFLPHILPEDRAGGDVRDSHAAGDLHRLRSLAGPRRTKENQWQYLSCAGASAHRSILLPVVESFFPNGGRCGHLDGILA
jgi:hypothetical protein